MLMILAASSMAIATAQPLSDSTQTSVDWDGYYKGTLPCASCSGIDTWFRLNDAGKTTYFTIIESYQGKKGSTFRTDGIAKWKKDGSTIEFVVKGKKRAVFVSEGYVEFLGPKKKPRFDKTHQLIKQDAFAGNGEQLLVDPVAMKVKGKSVTFPALMNFEHRTEGGHKSLTANFVINCSAKTAEMPQVAYFKGDFATGKLIHKEIKNTNGPQPLAGGDDVVSQAAKAYCAN